MKIKYCTGTGRVFVNKPIIKITQVAAGVVVHTSAGDKYEVRNEDNFNLVSRKVN